MPARWVQLYLSRSTQDNAEKMSLTGIAAAKASARALRWKVHRLGYPGGNDA